ncbi:hypothetical protein EMA8858_01508 [Emticicia aquatica]|uniref:HTH LytTR-type domain-containing protein n=1 Tax=Emticicia aquatica TaxID=1681835 RepID=A0ABN8ER87_9BACT|nr:LytTR family DNA-binding domain-containing protein [Emticicia aquatica]CAH0995387.1 hypothetical protein EMA8858_01508 [Emticicia aquatica]
MNTLEISDMPIQVGSRLAFLPNEMVFLEASINYTNLHLADGQKVIVSYHLGKLQKRLQGFPCFARLNKSVIVNLQYIEGFANDYLELREQQFFMSRRRKKIVLAMLDEYTRQNNPVNDLVNF